MDIGLSLRFAIEDKKWVEKILIAALLIFTVIGGVAVLGWAVEIIRRVIRQDQELLPGWSEIGKYFVDGLIVLAVVVIWMLPLIIVAGCLGLFSAIASSAASDNSGNGGISTLLSLCIGVLSLPYGLAVSFLIPPMLGIHAMRGRFAEAVNPANAWRLARANLGGFAVAWLVAAVVGFVASVVGTILCLIGTYPLGAYAAAVSAHLYGQAYREGMAGLPAV